MSKECMHQFRKEEWLQNNVLVIFSDFYFFLFFFYYLNV